MGMLSACAFFMLAFPEVNARSQVRDTPPAKYDPDWKSLNRHPVPKWFEDAKLGIFIHWGLYSVPGWAPTLKGQWGSLIGLNLRTPDSGSGTIPTPSGT